MTTGFRNAFPLPTQTHSISGSVFGEEPNLVQIDNHRSFPAFKPEGTIIMFRCACGISRLAFLSYHVVLVLVVLVAVLLFSFLLLVVIIRVQGIVLVVVVVGGGSGGSGGVVGGDV